MTAILLLAAITAVTPAQSARRALQLLNEGRTAEAAGLLDSLSSRMPSNARLAYDLSAALFADSAFAEADTVASSLDPEEGHPAMGRDTLESADAASKLAAAMIAGDHGAVRQAAAGLRRLLAARGDPAGVDATNLEAALNWLENHDPPPEQDEGGSAEEDQEEQQSDDQEQPSNEPSSSNGEEEQDEGVPEIPEEMTPEMARRILDMVEEASPMDTTKAGATGGRLSW